MKTVFAGIFAGVVLCGVFLAQGTTPAQINDNASQGLRGSATAQSAEPSSGQRNGVIRVAPGSVIPVQLTKSIDAKKMKSGDKVEAKVTQDLKAGNGAIVVPKDTKIVGHVTEAQARNKEQKNSQIGLAFDHAVMKNGGDVPLPMSIQAIIAPPSANPDNGSNAGGENAGSPASAPSVGGMPGNGGGRMGTGMPPQAPSSSGDGGEGPTSVQTTTNGHQPITGDTQGVVGISNLKLSTAATMPQGSVISSEKGNVKLESGTLMLLRVVNQ